MLVDKEAEKHFRHFLMLANQFDGSASCPRPFISHQQTHSMSLDVTVRLAIIRQDWSLWEA